MMQVKEYGNYSYVMKIEQFLSRSLPSWVIFKIILSFLCEWIVNIVSSRSLLFTAHIEHAPHAEAIFWIIRLSIAFSAWLFIITTQAYLQGTKWKQLLINLNAYQKNTTIIGLQFHCPKLNRQNCFTLSSNCAGLRKERSTKQATYNLQRRAL